MNSTAGLVILTGAGISAESGLATFRGSAGLWHDHRIEDVASPQAFERQPELVQSFYNERRRQLATVVPNAAHLALARLAEIWPGSLLLVTQNIDDLHERALARCQPADGMRLLHMHGELTKARCTNCAEVLRWQEDLFVTSVCPECGRAGGLRPHIVWFGEVPFSLPWIIQSLKKCELFVAIGTSGQVQPAAGFVQVVREQGKGRTIELNLDDSIASSLFHERRRGAATELVPQLVQELTES